jgi:hypothetical protein
MGTRLFEEVSSNLLSLKHEVQSLRKLMISRKYNPDQPRVPAGNPDGGQWAGAGAGSSNERADQPPTDQGFPQQVAGRRVSKAREAFCEAQFDRDTFHCTMVGLPACHQQARLRYSNCLVGRQIPPLNY